MDREQIAAAFKCALTTMEAALEHADPKTDAERKALREANKLVTKFHGRAQGILGDLVAADGGAMPRAGGDK